jgi:hypothetical protein
MGYIMEVDLEIPESLHDKFNDYPPAPMTRCVEMDELSSSYQHPLMDQLGITETFLRTPKLVADLNHKKNYIAHYRTLQKYIEMGVKVTRVERVLSFSQAAWMKPFIDFNTSMRNQAKNEFEKNFWKLLSNSAFGKTIENKRKRQNVIMVCSEEQAVSYTKKPTMSNIIPINSTTCLFVMKRLSVYLDKPIAVGTSIMEISKSVMYDMHYNCIQKFYGERARLVYSDTDSFIFHLTTNDMYEDFKTNINYFDMSEYEPQHPHFGKFVDNTNKKVLGKFKDEFKNAIITNVWCPRPKMYGLRALTIDRAPNGEYLKEEDGNWKFKIFECKKAKGITHTAVSKHVPLSDYADVLTSSTQTFATMKLIRSKRHVLFTEETVKKALNGLDTKRYAIDAVNTLALGHRDIVNV